MPWETIQLNNGTRTMAPSLLSFSHRSTAGRKIPSIAFGTWKIGNGDGTISQVDQAISVGFSHVDTAQAYRNETEAGIAIRESGLARDDIFVTTKYSGLNGADIKTSIQDSLNNASTLDEMRLSRLYNYNSVAWHSLCRLVPHPSPTASTA